MVCRVGSFFVLPVGSFVEPCVFEQVEPLLVFCEGLDLLWNPGPVRQHLESHLDLKSGHVPANLIVFLLSLLL